MMKKMSKETKQKINLVVCTIWKALIKNIKMILIVVAMIIYSASMEVFIKANQTEPILNFVMTMFYIWSILRFAGHMVSVARWDGD